MVLNVTLHQVEAGRLVEKSRVEKVFTAVLAITKDNDDNENNNNNSNDDDKDKDNDDKDDDNTMQKAASMKMSPKVTRKIVVTKPLPKVVKGGLKANLVSFHIYCLELIHIFVV